MIKLDLYESRTFGKICYGFGRNGDGIVFVIEDEAEVVKMIFKMSSNGYSLQNIQTELQSRGIKSSSGRDTWTRDVIDKTIKNPKYLAYIISFEDYYNAAKEKHARCRNGRSNG